ncbi:MAG: hypothetical protein U1F70_13215 [Candidatus Competibacteraceae bacterium]
MFDPVLIIKRYPDWSEAFTVMKSCLAFNNAGIGEDHHLVGWQAHSPANHHRAD